MKSDKASSTEVNTETYCRHGFHEWLEIDEDEEGLAEEVAQDNASSSSQPKYKCKHCGLTRVILGDD